VEKATESVQKIGDTSGETRNNFSRLNNHSIKCELENIIIIIIIINLTAKQKQSKDMIHVHTCREGRCVISFLKITTHSPPGSHSPPPPLTPSFFIFNNFFFFCLSNY